MRHESQTSLKLLTRNCQTPSLWDHWAILPPPEGLKKLEKKKKELMCYIHFLNKINFCWCFSAWSSKQGVMTVTNRQRRAGKKKNHMEFSTKGQKLGGVEFKKPATIMASPSILSSTQIETGIPSCKHSDSTKKCNLLVHIWVCRC